MTRTRRFTRLPMCLLVTVIMLSSVAANAQLDQTGQWTTLTTLPFFPVHDHLLPNGKVMIWPGDGGISGNDPRLWDPATQEVTLLKAPGYDVFCTGHAFLADGRLFVAGGHIQNGVGLPKASLYNPFSNTWDNAPDMNAGRWYPTVTTLANGDALVVSGSIDNTVGGNTLPQVYQAASNTWRSLTSAQLGQDLYPMMFLAPNGKVFDAAPTQTTRYPTPPAPARGPLWAFGCSGGATMDPPSCMRTARSWWWGAGIHPPTPRKSSTLTSRCRPGAQWRP